jgi:two-component system NarL family response regulator
MNFGSLSRTDEGSVAIAGVDSSYARRLLQTLRAGNGHRPISTVTGGRDIAKQIAASVPSVILYDLGPKPDDSGLATVSALARLTKTIVLAGTDDDTVAVQALKAGAAGFCLRDTPGELLRRAVQLVEAGEIWVSRRVMVRLIEELALRAAVTPAIAGGEQLTPRERELVRLVADGASNKEIARRCAISVKTVKTHLTSIFKKLGLSTRLELAVAVRRAAAAEPATAPQTKVG